jgi:phage pi2 protein 07
LALRFVRTFTPEQLEGLCALVLPNGDPVTWNHVRTLLEVKGVDQRQELLERTVDEGWTCTQLAQQIKNREDGTVKDARGRPPVVPTSFDGAVAQQRKSADAWDRQFTKVWVDRGSLATRARNLSADDVTEQRLQEARELAWQLRQVASQAQQQAEMAEGVVLEFERVLSERGRVEITVEPVTRVESNPSARFTPNFAYEAAP